MNKGDTFEKKGKTYTVVQVYKREQPEKDMLLCIDIHGIKECFQRFDITPREPNRLTANHPPKKENIAKTPFKDWFKKKSVEQLDKDGNVIARFESVRKASDFLGISTETVSNICRGEHKSKRYDFRFAEVQDD